MADSNWTRKLHYRHALLMSIASAIYLWWCHAFIGYKMQHLGLCIFVLLCWFLHPSSRKFVIAFSAFLFFWIIYDSLRIVHNYEVNSVHIQDLFQMELKYFPAPGNMTWNMYWQKYPQPFLDILGGLFYLCWVPVPMLFTAWIWHRDKKQVFQFTYTFLLVNILGFIIYYMYPAAPPWYVAQYGTQFLPHVPPDAGGLLRFDAITGTRLFENMYTENANVFAAMPSLHAAYPVVALIQAIRMKVKWLIAIFGILTLGIWFSAVYLNHHYILDILAGGSIACLGTWIFHRLIQISFLRKALLYLEQQLV